MAIVKLQSRGQLTLPKSVRKALGAKPGDTLLINPTGEGRAEIAKLEPMTFDEALERSTLRGPSIGTK